MKSKELKELKVLNLTDKQIDKFNKMNGAGRRKTNIRTKSSSWVYKYNSAIVAAVEKGILKIAIFKREDIEKNKKEPVATMFIDKEDKEWKTYIYGEDKWSNATIFNLMYRKVSFNAYDEEYTYTDELTNKVVKEYLNEAGSVKKVIYNWQNYKGNKKRMTEIQQIDSFMESVPEVPRDFEKYVWNTVFRNEATFIFMKAGKVDEGYCTHCRQMVPIPSKKPKHNEKGKCKKCGTVVTYKGWNKQESINTSRRISLVQRCNEEEYVLRIFEASERYRDRNWNKSDRHIGEIYRYRLNRWFDKVEVFEHGEFRRTGVIRWCHEIPKGMGYWYGPSSEGIPYTKNLKRILKNSPIPKSQYIPIAEILKNADEKQYIELDKVLQKCNKYPDVVEKLGKIKMYRICNQICKEYNFPDELNQYGSKLKEILDLPMEYIKQAVQMNADRKDIMIMQAAVVAQKDIAMKNISIEQIDKVREYFKYTDRSSLIILFGKGNLTKTLNYLDRLARETEQPDRIAIGRDYRDYLEQLEKLQIPATKKNKFPQNFYEAHEELTEIIEEKAEAVRKLDIKRKNKELKKLVKKLEKLYTLNSEEYEIVWPKSKKDFIVEGQLQHNCVGGYFDRVVEESTVVFFLRKKEEMKKPFCTVEFMRGRCIQCRTAYNKEAPAEVMNEMKKITKNYMKNIKQFEKTNCNEVLSMLA